MKKILKTILTPAIAFSSIILMTGCPHSADNNNNKSNSGNPEPLNISIFTFQNEKQPPENNKTYKWIKDTFGVSFTWDILDTSTTTRDDYIQELISTGNLPDLVEVDSAVFQNEGTLRDLKPLIEEYCPNLKKHYQSAWNKMIFVDSEKDDGGQIVSEHIYSLPNYGVIDDKEINNGYTDSAWWIQKAVLIEYGYPQIKTIDQYFDLIEAYYKKYSTIDGMPTVPFSIITQDWEQFNFFNPPGFLAGYPNDGYGHVKAENGIYTYEPAFADEHTKRWLKLANGYFQRGLIDPASFTDNHDQYFAKIEQGRVLGMFIQGWEFQGTTEQTLWTNDLDSRTYAPLALTFDETIKPNYRNKTVLNLQRGYGITVKCPKEKAIKILKFMDEMLKVENQKILYWGFEGEDYTFDSLNRPVRTQQQYTNQNDPNWIYNNKAQLWANEAPKLEGYISSSGYCSSISDLPWEYEKNYKQVDKDLFAAYKVNSYAEFVDPNPPENPGWFPMWQCYPVDGDAATSMSECETQMKKFFPHIIMGKPADFDKTWNEYSSLIQIYQVTFATYMQEQLDQRIATYGGVSD